MIQRAFRRLPAATAVFVLVAGALAVISYNIPAVYHSKALLVVTAPAAPAGDAKAEAARSVLVDVEVRKLNSSALAERIAKQVGLSVSEVDRSVSAERRGTSDSVALNIVSGDAAKTKMLADAALAAYETQEAEARATAGREPASVKAARNALQTLNDEQARLAATKPKADAHPIVEDANLIRARTDLAAAKRRAATLKALARLDNVAPRDVAALRRSGVANRMGDVADGLVAAVNAYEAADTTATGNAQREQAKYRILNEGARVSAAADAAVQRRTADIARMVAAIPPVIVIPAPELVARLQMLDMQIDQQTKALEAAVAQGAAGGNARVDVKVVAPPGAGEARIWRQPIALYSASLLLAALLAAAYLALATKLSDTLMDPRDAAALAGEPVVVGVPKVSEWSLTRLPLGGRKWNPANLVTEGPSSGFAEAMRAALDSVVAVSASNTSLCVAVVGAQPGDGATTVSLGLARTAAATGVRVLLIDADIERGGLTRTLGIDAPAGVQSVMSGESGFQSLLLQDENTAVHLLPSAPNKSKVGAPSLSQLEAFRSALAQARAAYDIIILDCQPHSARSRTWSIARMADGAMVVVSYNVTKRIKLSAVVHHILQGGMRISAVAFNLSPGRVPKVRARSADVGSALVTAGQPGPAELIVTRGTGRKPAVLRRGAAS